jgi:hypothetical protein
MLPDLSAFRTMPPTVKAAQVLNVSGWGWLLFTIHRFYDPQALFKFAVAGCLLCSLVFMGKNWARMLALLACAFVVLYGGMFAMAFAGSDTVAMAASLVNVALFAAAFGFLAARPTARWFKSQTPPQGGDRSQRGV